MSKEHPTAPSLHGEHGATMSYIIGFVLSLVFTINPYFIVVNKMVSGNALIALILTFAIVQMFIQLFFFLHLGRGPKPLYNVIFFWATAAIILVTIGGSIFIMNNLYRNMSPAEVTTRLAQDESIAEVGGLSTGACKQNYTNHQITIKDGVVTPSQVTANLCDTVTFINADNTSHDIIYGAPGAQVSYGGEDDLNLPKGYPGIITLNQAGAYSFYDKTNPAITGRFTVTKKQ